MMPTGERACQILTFQSSHGFSAVDTIISAASMVRFVLLQSSHGFSAVDTECAGLPCRLAKQLQSSHGFSAVDTPSASPLSTSTFTSFNRATAFQPWIQQQVKQTYNGIAELQSSHGFSAVDTFFSLYY